MFNHVSEKLSSNRNPTWSRVSTFLTAALMGGIGAFFVLRVFRWPVGHDQSWLLYAASQVLHGVKLNGAELVETNPPFIVWFMSLPVVLGQMLHLGILNGFRVFVIGVVAITSAWSALLFYRLRRPTSLLLWLFLLLLCVDGWSVAILNDVGQREHLVVFLLLPYLLVAAFRIEGRTLPLAESLLIGIVAAVAMCLKPQHLLDLAVVELLVLYRLRNLRAWVHPTWVALTAGCFVYLVSARLFAPSYFANIIPLLVETYWGLNAPLLEVLQREWVALFWAAVCCVVYLLQRRHLRMRTLITIIMAAAFGALLAYVQQHKGWVYQSICFRFFVYLALGLIAIDVLDRLVLREAGEDSHPVKFLHAGAVSLVVFAVVFAALFSHLQNVPYGSEPRRHLAAIYGAYPRGTVVALYSPSPWEFPIVIDQGKVWGSRYFHLWMLPAIMRSEDPADTDKDHHLSAEKEAQLVGLLRTTEAEDLAHWQPQVVVEDPCGGPDFCAELHREHFAKLVDWFSVSPEFREQWSHYSFQRSVNGLDVYTRTR